MLFGIKMEKERMSMSTKGGVMMAIVSCMQNNNHDGRLTMTVSLSSHVPSLLADFFEVLANVGDILKEGSKKTWCCPCGHSIHN